jgi:hypothetical protein
MCVDPLLQGLFSFNEINCCQIIKPNEPCPYYITFSSWLSDVQLDRTEFQLVRRTRSEFVSCAVIKSPILLSLGGASFFWQLCSTFNNKVKVFFNLKRKKIFAFQESMKSFDLLRLSLKLFEFCMLLIIFSFLYFNLYSCLDRLIHIKHYDNWTPVVS